MLEGDDVSAGCYNALEDIFLSCYLANQRHSTEDINQDDQEEEEEGCISLRQAHLLLPQQDNMMYTFFHGIQQTRQGLLEGVREVMKQYGRGGHPTPPPRTARNKREEQDVPIFSQATLTERTEPVEKSDASAVEAKQEVEQVLGSEWRGLTLEGFVRFIHDYTKQDVRAVWTGLRACGFDLQLERVAPSDPSQV